MSRLGRFVGCLVEAVCATGLRALVGVVPFGKVLCDVVGHALERLREDRRDRKLRKYVADATRARESAPPPAVEVEPHENPESQRLQKLLAGVHTNPFAWLLDLTNKQVGDEGVEELVQSPAFSRLSVLYLSGNLISDAGVKMLASSSNARNLSRLILWDNNIGDEGVAALADSPYLANLTALDLGRNRVGDDGAAALARSRYLTNLNVLILVSNRVGDMGALALADSDTLRNLAELKPLNNRIGSAGVTALRTRFGKRVRIY